MNQLYRALHMPPARLAKKLAGWKEVYTIAVRPVPAEPGHEPLPALGDHLYQGGKCFPHIPSSQRVWHDTGFIPVTAIRQANVDQEIMPRQNVSFGHFMSSFL